MDPPWLVEPVECTAILPVEMWQAVVDRLISTEDLNTCRKTCRAWRNLILANNGTKTTLLLPKVIPILWGKRFVSYPEVLKCRLVCRRWKHVVDSIPGFRTPFSEWTISYEVADSTRFGDWIDEEGEGGWRRRAEAVTYHNAYNERSSCWEYSVKYPFPEERLMHGDPRFLPVMNSLQFDPTLTTSLVYHIGLNQLYCLQATANNSLRERYYYDGMHFRHGNQVWTLAYQSFGEADTAAKFTTCLFLHFPNLKRLKLQISLRPSSRFSTGAVSDAFLAKADRSISKQANHLQREEGSRIQLNHLTELCLQGAEACFSGNEHFPRVISALILSAPRLEKVEWTSVPDDEHILYHRAVAEVLGACAKARVKSLEVRYWALRQPFDELLPAEQPWPLKKLWIRVDDSGGFMPVLHCFHGIVKKFWSSLEELHFETVMSDVCGLWTDELGRICSCNQSYVEFPESEQPMIPDCERRALWISCVKLRILEIPHSFTHPNIFPCLMNSCPVIAEVRIRDGREAWRGREKRLQKLAFKLWSESGLSLRLIVFQLEALRDTARFSRRRFERRWSPDYKMYLFVAFCGFLVVVLCFEMFW